jgi:multidrug efflux system outer membrane protein
MSRGVLYLTLAVSLVALTGCIKMGPDYQRPDPGTAVPSSFHNVPHEPVMSLPEDQWWEVFRDPELDQLVEEALANNLDIKQATARVLEVRTRFVQARADGFPQVGFDGVGRRQKTPIIGVIPGRTVTNTTDVYTVKLPASFEVDLWGRLARAEEAARADLLQAEENRHTVSQTVVAETVTLYLQMESLERRIEITLRSMESFQRSLDYVEGRYRRGLTSSLDVRQARRILAGARALLPSLRQELSITQQRLSVLLGRYPETRPPRKQPEDYFQRLEPVPPGLTSDLLLRRPDLKSAEAGLRALNARVGVAKASRFPRITLTGESGYSSDELSNLFRPETQLWNIALGIAQPLFDAGRLKAGQRAAEARYDQGAAQFAKTLLTAFSEVEGALVARREELERRERLLRFFQEARATQEVAESRYSRGLVNYLDVLEAQRTRFEAEENLVLVDLAIFTNRVSLHRALGGGWAQLPPVPAEEDLSWMTPLGP